MVKFKFPGRPSKIVQRNLVSAYSVVLSTSDTSSISEDFCYGLTVFHECFGEDDEGDSFQGFNNDEVEDALLRKKKLERDITQEMISRGLRIPIIPLTRVELRDNKIVEIPTVSKSINIDKKPTKESIFKPKVKEKKKSNKFSILNKRILNRYHPKIQFRHNFKTLNKNSLIRFKHKSLSANYLSDRYCRKFILPTRSLHSSRVIKPNKRFLDHDRKLHERKLKQKDIYNFDGNSSDSSSDCEKQRKTDPPSKVIIREARLNITTETTITGPFSAKKFVSDDKKSRSGVITCGICGSVRFYKYVLQTRKFGIYSCESCRRFILRMIKYSKELNSEVLTCKAVEGVGKCVILPVLSNEAKETNDDSVSSKNSRCEACLLRLCLEKYIMPIEIKKLLTGLIPEEIKSNFLNSLSPDFKKSLPALNDSLNGFSETVSNIYSNEKLRKRLNTHNCLKNPRCFKKTESKFLHRRITLRQKTNFKNKPVEENGRKGNFVEKEPYLPRGPRIKHVCRSASSVLRTSTTSDKDFDDSPCNLSEVDCAKNLRKSGEIKVSEKSCQMTKIRQCDDSVPNVENSMETESTKQIETHFGARTLQDFSKDSSDESDENEDKFISTDFWEPYDPDEVYKTGFPLISSEALNVRALCFLCGSAGIEKLLYCVSCCEPYHWYCAEGPSAFREESELEKCRVNWVCRKCKVCSTCGERDSRTLISCQRCKNSFHTECLTNKALNKRLFKSDRPWVCPACLKCKSCNSNSVFTYLGNIPLCSQCFKLRQKGSFCPLCQRCYQDDDYNVKMMECGICEKWIHAKCEGISHEKYQILSFLPDTIEFVCRLCCNVPPAQWWLAVEDELKAGFFGILKCLCKNKKINDLFKESPRKDMCRCRKNKKRNASLSDDSDSCVDVDSELKTTSSDSSFCAEKHDSGVDDMFSNSKPFLKGDPDQLCSFCSYNSETRNKINRDLLSIKAKVHNNQFSTLSGFHQELENVILNVGDGELMKIYRDSLKKFFPWFDPDCIESDDNRDDILFESNTDCCTAIVNSSNQDAGTEEEYSRLRELMNNDEFSYDAFKMLDVRKCNLCKGMGEAIPSEGGRLIYCGRNEWVHSNCALWSSEVFEEIDGSLQNVHSAISRGRQIRCNVCDKKGASVGCCYKNCTQTYHFLCAKKAACIFLQNRTIYCQSHDTQEVTLPFLNCEKDFEILRPVYIEMDRKKKKMDCHTNVRLRIGSLHVENLGKIDPHLSDNPKYIIPIYYRCSRLFWSVSKPWKIVQYHVQIKLRYSYEPVKCSTEMNYTVDHSAKNSDDEIVEHVLKELVNKVCSKEDDFFPGMQNGNDLLSPELQEAIYKDFPNDLLDDKTLQDIWNDYDGLNETECSAEKNQMKKFSKAEVKTEKDKKIKKVNEVETNEHKWEEKKINTNGKYLRDKNDFKDAIKKNHLSGFYNDIKSKAKRKIDFENTSLTNAKKILLDGNYIGNDFYQEADRNFKPPYVQSYENILQLDGMVDIIDEEPVKCLRCHRTYRTTLSFDRHLEICNLDFNDYMISSCESDTSSEEEKFNSCSKPLPKKDFRDAYDTQKSNNVYPQVAKSPAVNPAFSSEACNNIGQNTIYTYSSVQENRTTNNQLENVGMQTFVQNIKQESITVATQPSVEDTMKFNVVNGKIKPEIVCNNFATQFAVNNVAQTQSYQIQNVTPTYVIQQFPKSEVIPTYVTVDSAITECIQSQDNLLQQPLQLQQITTVNQPPVIQPVIPTFLVQPSVIETPTYIVNTPSSTELFAPQNNIILPNQPVLFGMETVVSNTVMSSSQFMTQSLTGDIGSSTLYSTTTTQVFQAAKPLPQPNYQSGFIVVNSPVQQPALQQIQTVVKPQPQPITPTEKYMYVQLNTPAPKIDNGPKPVITKAVKNNAIPKDKPVKVMKVRNNKPVVVPVTLSSSIKTYKNNENVSVVKVNGSKPIPNGIHPNVERPCKIEKFDVAINTSFSSPNPISSKTVIPNVSNSSPRESTEKCQKVDKCVNTDRKDLQTIKLSYSINNADENAKPTIKSWQINLSPESHVSVPPQSPKLNELVAPLSKTVLSPDNKSESTVSSPPPSKIESPVVLSLPTLTTKDDKTDSDKLFDELLRQHMLSMEKETKLEEDPPKCKIYSKHKYKPQINPKLNAEEPKESKIIVKKKISPEKENNNKAKATETENVKNWKTASISFEVNAEDGFSYKTNNLKDLWNKIIDSVQKSRAKCKLPLLPKNAMVNAESIYSLLGFENNASKYLLEQLPDAWKCIFYKPVFHKSSIQSSKTSPLKNETGCARTEPVNSSHKHDMFGWLASRHRKPPKFMMISDSDIVNGNRRITSLNLPMAMRFRHLKETAKETVGVFRSDIHGRGLFCLRDIDPGEMVIEYAGEVIRSTLTDKRERYYTSKGIGCYMFRIDDKYVVDATMCGNAARFINHSCEPNCYSRIVDILGKKHILIFALRKIPKGEELTYDYKFPLEDDKIYCHCLSRKCRKYLN